MPLRVPRFRVRTLMAVVAIAAVGAWAERSDRRERPLRRAALAYESMEQVARRQAELYRSQARMEPGTAAASIRYAGECMEDAEIYGRLKRRWRSAADRVWLHRPAPPEPE